MRIKNFLIIFTIVIFATFIGCLKHNYSQAQQPLQGYVQKVPENFFGSWRVIAKRIETDSPETFKEKTIDLWNISQSNDVIKLCNPFSGAEAELTIEKSANGKIEFTKRGKYNNKILTDSVIILIQGDTFTGIDTLRLDTISDVDNSIRKTATAKYSIKGERLSGQTVK
jgi:hypothetical protein